MTYYKRKNEKYFYAHENDRTKFAPPTPVPAFIPDTYMREAGRGRFPSEPSGGESSGMQPDARPYTQGRVVRNTMHGMRMPVGRGNMEYQWDSDSFDDSATYSSEEAYLTDDDRRMHHLLGVIRHSPYIHVSKTALVKIL